MSRDAGTQLAAFRPTPDAPADARQRVPWCHPWYEPWRSVGQAVERAQSQGSAPWQALNQVDKTCVLFVPHTDLPDGTAYERHVAQTGTCPTRPGLHDFFNGLCWIKFPSTKTRLNQLQAEQIAQNGVLPHRGALRDALTVFDENAAFMQAPDALWNALVARQWHPLFADLRPLWREARLTLFGHALLEKLHMPRKAVTAHVYRVLAPAGSIADLDAWVATDITREKMAAKPFTPLPVLGVPGWWPANENPEFYEDTQVFRPLRQPVAGAAM